MKQKLYIKFIFLLMFSTFIFNSAIIKANNNEYKDGIYTYELNTKNKTATLTYVNSEKDTIEIPSTVNVNGSIYQVSDISSMNYESDHKIKKVIISENFTGSLDNIAFKFINMDTVEFKGNNIPEKIYIALYSGRDVIDLLFIVPDGLKEQYMKALSYSMGYSNGSDLTEKSIPLTPTVITASENLKNPEFGVFYQNNIIYKVIKSGNGKTGEVALVGLNGKHKDTYLSLPSTITNNGFHYKLTEIHLYGLKNSMAKIISIPNTVKKMESNIFDPRAKLIFFSKNCKVLPRQMFDYESYSDIVFMHVPEGVTTINKDSFNFGKKSGSIILPTTIKNIENGALADFKLITFLNNKPIANIPSAIIRNKILTKGTTVKVNKSAISAYKKIIGKKASVVQAKNITKSKSITLNKANIKIAPKKTFALTAKLSKGSNENIYWLSSDDSIIQVSNKGKITAKKAGTAYVIAYTRTSGLHKAVKVTVTK